MFSMFDRLLYALMTACGFILGGEGFAFLLHLQVPEIIVVNITKDVSKWDRDYIKAIDHCCVHQVSIPSLSSSTTWHDNSKFKEILSQTM
jgi:hypothetical protein